MDEDIPNEMQLDLLKRNNGKYYESTTIQGRSLKVYDNGSLYNISDNAYIELCKYWDRDVFNSADELKQCSKTQAFKDVVALNKSLGQEVETYAKQAVEAGLAELEQQRQAQELGQKYQANLSQEADANASGRAGGR